VSLVEFATAFFGGMFGGIAFNVIFALYITRVDGDDECDCEKCRERAEDE
jgi:hypothetical protein